MSRLLAIVGRPNVGKSTFFNRLTKTKQAIVHESSGVTRDRHYGRSDWNGVDFSVIDTGGYVRGSEDVFEDEIRKQVMLAIEEAQVIVFLVDVTTGPTDIDMQIAKMLRRVDKKVFLVCNKVDNGDRIFDAQEFYKLGLGEVFTVSSINGSGTGELLDEVAVVLGEVPDEEQLDLPRFAFVGRPNVGKSTMINTLIGEERNIVTPIAGTTRDTLDTRYNKYGHDFYLVDTAGLRKKGKVHENIEFYSVMRSIRAIEKSDVCILMIDATQGLETQDLNIFSVIKRNNKGVVIVVNKWDLVEKDHETSKSIEEYVKKKLAPFTDLPIIFISALNKQRINKVLEVANQVYHNRRRKIKTSVLNEVMLDVIKINEPPIHKGKKITIKYVTQLPTYYPAFAFFCNSPQYVKEPYKRYLENQIRKNFEFTGSPIKIYTRMK